MPAARRRSPRAIRRTLPCAWASRFASSPGSPQAVVDAVGSHPAEPAMALLAGDALRLLGRETEARAAFDVARGAAPTPHVEAVPVEVEAARRRSRRPSRPRRPHPTPTPRPPTSKRPPSRLTLADRADASALAPTLPRPSAPAADAPAAEARETLFEPDVDMVPPEIVAAPADDDIA